MSPMEDKNKEPQGEAPNGMSQRERMLAGLPYQAWRDGLLDERIACKQRVAAFNALLPGDEEQAEQLLREILGPSGKDIHVEPPFRCDYGRNITVGDGFFANFNLTVLDVNRVMVGNHVLIAPNVSIYTAGHPVHPDSRRSGYEYGIPVTIGNDVWIGGDTVILPGVTIGDGAVIGAGSVVDRDVPPMVVAAGNPCRVKRAITPEDRDFYYKRRPFDVEDY